MKTALPAALVKAPPPGIYPNVPFSEYLKWPLLSYSAIKYGRSPQGSMKKLSAAFDGELTSPPTDDMVLGSALHTAFLEPELSHEKVALWDGKVRRGDEWEQFKRKHAGKAILTQKAHEKMVSMTRSIRANKWVQANIGLGVKTEVSAVGTYNGVQVRGRADILLDDMIVDIKKMRGVDTRTITNTIFSFGYHIQAAIYRKLFNRDRFVLICVEGTKPYDCVAVELMDDVLTMGETDTVTILDQYKHAVKIGRFAGQCDDLLPINVPDWMADKDAAAAITIGGEGVFGEDE